MDEIENYYCQIRSELQQFCKYFDNFEIYDIPEEIFSDSKYAPLREYAVFRMGFSVVTKRNCEILAQIFKQKKVLEIMCGLGSYTATLKSLGVDIKATDDMSWIDYDKSKYQSWRKNAWEKDIESIDAKTAILKYGKNIDYILMSWPPQNEPSAFEALVTMRAVNPNCRMVYVGEEQGGCTANSDFFENLINISDEYDEIEELRKTYRSWKNNGYFDQQFIIK